MDRGEGIYHILALTAVAIWGTTFVSTKLLLAEGMTPAEIMFYRFLIAYLALKLYKPTFRLPESWRDEALFAAAGLTGGSLYFLTENMALQITLASNVALLLATAPILTVLLSRLWLGRSERIGRPLAAGSVLALAGVALVVFNGSFILKIQPAGDLLTLAAALTWALYNICLKKLDGRHSTLEITRKVFFYGVVTLLPVFAFTPLRFDTALFRNPVVAGNLLFLGLVASLFCFAVWNTAVKHLGADQFGHRTERTDHARRSRRSRTDPKRSLHSRKRSAHQRTKTDSPMNELNIRPAGPEDSATIYGFIMKMARYEKLESEVDTTEQALRKSLFEERQAEVVLGELNGRPVGFALFFHNFSTFRGQRGLYLEDIYVDEEYRGRGYGKRLLLHLVKLAAERRCRRMEWVVLDWNAPSIAFYRSLGAVPMDEWTVFRLTEDKIRELAAGQTEQAVPKRVPSPGHRKA